MDALHIGALGKSRAELAELKAQVGEQEPVAWMNPTVPMCVSSNEYTYKDAIPLFTHPTTERRAPKPITDEEIK